eukprot:28605-Pelagomonas_calceolata.AAC.7
MLRRLRQRSRQQSLLWGALVLWSIPTAHFTSTGKAMLGSMHEHSREWVRKMNGLPGSRNPGGWFVVDDLIWTAWYNCRQAFLDLGDCLQANRACLWLLHMKA